MKKIKHIIIENLVKIMLIPKIIRYSIMDEIYRKDTPKIETKNTIDSGFLKKRTYILTQYIQGNKHSTEVTIDYGEKEVKPDVETRFCHHYIGNEKAGGALIHPFPGNCGIRIITNLYLSKIYHGNNYSNIFRNQLFEIARQKLNASCIIATTISTNMPERITAKKNGYKIIQRFINRNTGNPIDIIYKNLY